MLILNHTEAVKEAQDASRSSLIVSPPAPRC
jgi:hypothetical protein